MADSLSFLEKSGQNSDRSDRWQSPGSLRRAAASDGKNEQVHAEARWREEEGKGSDGNAQPGMTYQFETPASPRHRVSARKLRDRTSSAGIVM
jgi:hypothetical protein